MVHLLGILFIENPFNVTGNERQDFIIKLIVIVFGLLISFLSLMIFILLFRRNRRRKSEALKITEEILAENTTVVVEETKPDMQIAAGESKVNPSEVSKKTEPDIIVPKAEVAEVKPEIKPSEIIQKSVEEKAPAAELPKKEIKSEQVIKQNPVATPVQEPAKKIEKEPKKAFDVQEYRRELALSDADKKRKELEERLAEIRRNKTADSTPPPTLPKIEAAKSTPVETIKEISVIQEPEAIVSEPQTETQTDSTEEPIPSETESVRTEIPLTTDIHETVNESIAEPLRNSLPEKKYTFTEWIQKLGNPG